MCTPGFTKAQADNLPKIDALMLADFVTTSDMYNTAETRGVKALRATRKSYVDAAVGYVEVQRKGTQCVVKGRVCPEHKVRGKAYSVSLIIDEDKEEIVEARCHDCPASEGGCKHALAFLVWVERKSEEPAVTSTACYWRRPRLAAVGTTLKTITAKEMSKSTEDPALPDNTGFLEELLKKAKITNVHRDSAILRHYTDFQPIKSLSLWQLLIDFAETDDESPEQFINFAQQKMTSGICQEAANATKDQSASSLWYELRYGRITASKIYEAAHCKTKSGSFVEQVIGTVNVRDTDAMERGRRLEKQVLKVAEDYVDSRLSDCGLILIPDYPILGASPDAIAEDFIVEVKCPSTAKAEQRYLKNKIINNKYLAQVQLQMLAARKKKALFCLAKANFETSKEVEFVWVDFDEDFTKQLVHDAMEFWKANIFPLLLESAKK